MACKACDRSALLSPAMIFANDSTAEMDSFTEASVRLMPSLANEPIESILRRFATGAPYVNNGLVQPGDSTFFANYTKLDFLWSVTRAQFRTPAR